MIAEASIRRGNPATTSDRWHVGHVGWCGKPADHPPFTRELVSEHGEDRTGAVSAARQPAAELGATVCELPLDERHRTFVGRPGFRPLGFAAQPVPRERR
jgi:hypothetical protein